MERVSFEARLRTNLLRENINTKKKNRGNLLDAVLIFPGVNNEKSNHRGKNSYKN
jgi:hypothetical protein